MKRYLYILLSLLCPLTPAETPAVEGDAEFRYLRAPRVNWQDARLSGELKDVPINDLLQELSWREGFELVIFGDLSESVNITFDDLTLEQSIKKIMRSSNLNYVMIFREETAAGDEPAYRVDKLIVYSRDKSAYGAPTRETIPQRGTQRPERTARGTPVRTVIERDIPPAPDAEVETSVPPPPDTSGEDAEEPEQETSETKVEFQGDPEDLKAYLDQLANEGRLTPKDREMILEQMRQPE